MKRRPTRLPGLVAHAARLRLGVIALFGVSILAAGVIGWLARSMSADPIAKVIRKRVAPVVAIDAILLGERGADGNSFPVERVRVSAQRFSREPSDDGLVRSEFFVRSLDRWIRGDRIALPSDELNGDRVAFFEVDLDGDGDADDAVDHRVVSAYAPEEERAHHQGFLVFGSRAIALGYDDGWGSREEIEHAELIEHGRARDLFVVLTTSAAEVGHSGRRLVIVTFQNGISRIAVDHAVYEPACIGLQQYRVGRVRIGADAIVARTVVHDATRESEGSIPIHVEIDRWERGHAYAHTERREPLRSIDGRIITHIRGTLPGVDWGQEDRSFRVDGAWITGVDFDELYELALAGHCGQSDRWSRWIARD